MIAVKVWRVVLGQILSEPEKIWDAAVLKSRDALPCHVIASTQYGVLSVED